MTSHAPVVVSVQEADFDLGFEISALRAHDTGVGAVASFVGVVREWTAMPPGDEAATLTLEHYPGMTQRSIEVMVAEARRRFDVRGIRVIHRFGTLTLGDQIVLVAVSSAHRRQAFECCEFLMDWLKTDAPFWKQESTSEGTRWVDAHERDDEARARWKMPPGGKTAE